jgi:hypothetical protein
MEMNEDMEEPKLMTETTEEELEQLIDVIDLCSILADTQSPEARLLHCIGELRNWIESKPDDLHTEIYNKISKLTPLLDDFMKLRINDDNPLIRKKRHLVAQTFKDFVDLYLPDLRQLFGKKYLFGKRK